MKKYLNYAKFFAILILIAYGIYNDILLDTIGGIPFIAAAVYMLIPRRALLWVVATEEY